MDTNHEDMIRERAYAIWEREGRPVGRDRDHWEAAERELTPMPLPPPPAGRRAAPRLKPAIRRARAQP